MHMKDESGNEGATKEHLYLIKTSDVQLSVYWLEAAEEAQNYQIYGMLHDKSLSWKMFLFLCPVCNKSTHATAQADAVTCHIYSHKWWETSGLRAEIKLGGQPHEVAVPLLILCCADCSRSDCILDILVLVQWEELVIRSFQATIMCE